MAFRGIVNCEMLDWSSGNTPELGSVLLEGGTFLSPSVANGVFGDTGIAVGNARDIRFGNWGAPTTLIFGTFFRIAASSSPGSATTFSWLNQNLGGAQSAFQIRGDGSLSFRAGPGSNTVIAPPGSIPYRSYGHLILKFILHDSAGQLLVKWNGHILYDSGTTVNTVRSGLVSDGITEFKMENQTLQTINLCHMWFDDTTDHGRLRTHRLLPIGDGPTNDFTPSTGTDHYAVVDNPKFLITDSDMLTTDTVNDEELWEFEDLPIDVGSIKAVMPIFWGNVDDASARQWAPLVRSADGLSLAVGTPVDIASSVQQHPFILEVNPNTTASWAASEVNGSSGARLGVRITT